MIDLPVRYLAMRAERCPRCNVFVEEGEYLHRVEVGLQAGFTCTDPALRSRLASLEAKARAVNRARQAARALARAAVPRTTFEQCPHCRRQTAVITRGGRIA